jgi:hypothetical protein
MSEHASTRSGLPVVRVRLLHLHWVYPRTLLGAITMRLKAPGVSSSVGGSGAGSGLSLPRARISHPYHPALVLDDSNHLLWYPHFSVQTIRIKW